MKIKYFIRFVFFLLGYFEDSVSPRLDSSEIDVDTYFGPYEKFHNSIVNSMNLSVNPCLDFYKYTCRKSSVNNQNRKHRYEKIWKWPKKMGKKLKKIVEDNINPNDDVLLKKVKQEYQTCMDLNKRQETGINLLISIVNEDGGWPMATDFWIEPRTRLLETQIYESSFFNVHVENNKLIISIDDFSVYGRFFDDNILFSEYINDPLTYVNGIVKLVEIVANHNGFNLSSNQLDKDIKDLMRFRSDLQKIAYRTYQVSKYNQVTLQTLQNLWITSSKDNIVIDWIKFCREVWKNVDNFEINQWTNVSVDQTYIYKLFQLLKTSEHRTIVNHIKLHFIESHLSDTTVELESIQKRLGSAATQWYVHPERSEWCISKPHLSRYLDYISLKMWYPENSRRTFEYMVRRIKHSWEKYIKRIKWLETEEKIEHVKNVNELRIIIGGEDKYENYDIIKSYFEYEMSSNYLQLVLNSQHRYKDVEFAQINKPIDVTLGKSHISKTKLTKIHNSLLLIPLGYLQVLNFNSTLPAVYLYSSLGSVIGVLLSRNLVQSVIGGWKSLNQPFRRFRNKNSSKFLKKLKSRSKTQCLIDQHLYMKDWEWFFYRNHDFVLLNIYHEISLNVAYMAFKNVLRKNQIQQDFMGAHHMNDQMFFYSFAHEFCENLRSSTYHYLYTTSHSTIDLQYSLNRILYNSNHFNKLFGCYKEKSFKKKCSFWD